MLPWVGNLWRILALFRIDGTLSGVISDAPSFTLADAVMFVGLPFMVISLSKSTEVCMLGSAGGIWSSFS